MSAWDDEPQDQQPLKQSNLNDIQEDLPLISQGLLQKHKSDYISNIDAQTLGEIHDLFYQHQNTGLFGLGKPYFEKDKLYEYIYKRDNPDGVLEEDVKNYDITRRIRQNNLIFQQLDGVFTASVETGQGLMNQYRLEAHLLADQKFQYFDEEGDLIVDREFFEEKMQKIFIVDFEENPTQITASRSATLCARSNQNKHRPFKLEIFIGSLEFTYHPEFSKEDMLVSDLRSRTNLALLPHLKKIKDILSRQLQELHNRTDYPKREMQNIKSQYDRNEQLYAQEKELLTKIMNSIYMKWEMIKNERQQRDYVGSPYKLVVRQYVSNENTNEIEFLLQSTDVNEQTNSHGQPLLSSELSRRESVRSFPIQIYIVINNQIVAKTKKMLLSWPHFKCQFKQQLQVYVYTKPSTIQFKIMHATFIPKIIDIIEVEIPGDKSNAMTSAGVVLKEAYFAQNREQARDIRYQSLVLLEDDMKQAQQDQVNGYEGFISYRTVWEQYGPRMPPESIDLQFAQIEPKYQDKVEEKLFQQDQNYFDVNDPRNDQLLTYLQNYRGVETEQNVSRIPFSNVISLRQRLLKLKYINPSLQDKDIPLMQESIRYSKELMSYIEEDELQRNYDLEVERQQKDGGMQLLMDFITDPATRKRLLEIQVILHQRKIEARLKRSSYNGGLLNLDNVVDEFHFEAAASLLAECIKQIFTKRRRLGVQKVSQIDRKNVTQITEVDISCLLVQANNVPIRTETLPDLNNVKQEIKDISNIKEVIEKLQKIKKVNPAIQLSLDIHSKNVFIIQRIQKKEKMEKIKATMIQPQLQELRAFGEEQDSQEVDQFQIKEIRIANQKQALEITSEVEGINPEWNELIEFTIGRERESDSFDPSDVINSRNKLTLTLFDQIGTIRQEPDNIDRYKLIIKRHYLGQVTIPLLTLFQQEKISGTFRIHRPIMMMNYQTLKVDQFLNDGSGGNANLKDQIQLHNRFSIIDPYVPTTVELSMTLDPAIKLNENFAPTDYYPGGESTNFFLYGVRQLELIQKDSLLRKRNIKFWAENLRGESIFLPRFLTPLQPPQIDFEANAIEKVARYVSLIPFKNDTEHFRDLPDIYCDGQEFLDLRAGDFEEHAILLCCYFMYIDQKIHKRDDIKSYVVMGKGLPEGNTLYVLRRLLNSNYIEIWNPQTGEPFVFQNEEFIEHIFGCFPISRGFRNQNDIIDQSCPLNTIGCVFDDQDIYINIQKCDSPSEISFDMDDHTKWKRFLNNEQHKQFYPKGVESVQRQIIYDAVDSERAAKVQVELEQYLKQQIIQHRKGNFENNKGVFTTNFVKQKYAEFSEFIRDILLVELESFKFRIRTTGLAKEASKKKNQKPSDDLENNQDQLLIEDQKLNQDKQWDYYKSLEFLNKLQLDLLKKKEKNIKDAREIYGFPLNFSYIDNIKAWDEINATGIQDILSDDIEYLCIVRCFPYPHYVISTWVFIAVLYNPNALQ